MATVIRGSKDLSTILMKQLYNAMVQLQESLPKYLEQFIYSEYYDQYEPTVYQRKYRIIKAIMTSSIKKTGYGYSLSVYLDPEKVSYDPAVFYDMATNMSYYIKGDPTEYVFNNMVNGIHGYPEIRTEGRFWDAFVKDISEGGTHDMFEHFKVYLSKKVNVQIL